MKKKTPKLQSAILACSLLTLGACSGGDNAGTAGDTAPGNSQSQTPLEFTGGTSFVYVERSIAQMQQNKTNHFNNKLNNDLGTPTDLSSPYEFNPGAKLYHRTGLEIGAIELDVLTDYFGGTGYDVKDVSVSQDGNTIVFAAHGQAGNSAHSSWSIYTYDLTSQTIKRVIADDTLANAGEDTNPTFTLTGDIVFSSDRSAGNPNNPTDIFVEENENCYKVGPSEKPSLLHIMNAYGENIVQLTYGNNHDTTPTTLKDGRVAFVRWSRSYKEVPQCATESNAGSGKSNNDIFTSFFNTQPDTQGLDAPTSWLDSQMCAYAIDTPVGPVLASNHYSL